MTIDEAIRKIEHFVFIEPGLLAKSIVRNFKKQRHANLDKLRIKGKDRCCWCNVGKIVAPKKRYCTENCRDSAFIYCNPNVPTSKGYLLIQRQSCACAGCGLSYESEIIAKIELYEKTRDEYNNCERRKEIGVTPWPEKAPYHYIFHGTGDWIQVDHIQPIFKGGWGIGLHNVQVLCVDCHKIKTIKEKL